MWSERGPGWRSKGRKKTGSKSVKNGQKGPKLFSPILVKWEGKRRRWRKKMSQKRGDFFVEGFDKKSRKRKCWDANLGTTGRKTGEMALPSGFEGSSVAQVARLFFEMVGKLRKAKLHGCTRKLVWGSESCARIVPGLAKEQSVGWLPSFWLISFLVYSRNPDKPVY